MQSYIRNIVISSANERELGEFYAQLLGMEVLRTDWFVIGHDRETFPRLAFDTDPDYQPPRWPDPIHPQQMHLDLPVFDVEQAEAIALSLGASKLATKEHFRVFSDPAGHPFCLYTDHDLRPGDERAIARVIGNIVFDCFSPRALAPFYQQILDLPHVVEDRQDWVSIAKDGTTFPRLAFQQAVFTPPRWPDPEFPQQMHLDIHVEAGDEAVNQALELGAIPLPPMGGSCPVFADPAGHPFCLCSPDQ